MNASFRKRNATAPAKTGQGAKVNRNSAAKTLNLFKQEFDLQILLKSVYLNTELPTPYFDAVNA